MDSSVEVVDVAESGEDDDDVVVADDVESAVCASSFLY